MRTNPKDLELVEAIKKRYGKVIDLDKSPTAILEIIQNYRHLLDEVAGPDGTGGGPGGPPPPPPGSTRPDVGTAAVLNLLLELQREVRALNAKVK
ncbi:hypothetical protein [Variovorax rhizosphaerae]|uniref:Uncharacterized protein n=1 Tax=Variovorax rhizosphaerae TaxID=1836200 RepID=A0ABU8WJG9_9BURK